MMQMPLGFGDGGLEGMWKRAAAGAKVLARDAMKGGTQVVHKMSEVDVKGAAKRLTQKVMERAEGSGFTLVEELPEIENAMANLKQTEAAYKELLAVLREAFSAQVHVVSKQLRVANKVEVIGSDLEAMEVGRVLCSYSRNLVTCSERARDLQYIKEAADVLERAQDDYDYKSYDSPASKLVLALDTFIKEELAEAMAARTRYKDNRREVSLNIKKVQDLEAKGHADKAASVKTTIEQGKEQLQQHRDELMRLFMNVEQKKPLLQSAVQTFLQAQMQFHEDCLKSTEEALVQCKG
ncbi:hypothetical protein GUITHDRAFT_107186 [Guillardia theta CCMP2712]|uniref:BAR domain-containing protein n=1 Tax=Guillardia theta (strain CCMP2712) TaxID=905079 RepID=L1JE81_GUITC|nr:hypothetical protein GUITHDRAFT_107186 [Guillardia theta CCMP2712]EKX46828.1 hypothetical protein GUITHDRAFT_107186 [Guillardia theta CCMP2712]|eukprot:XP_005833808.1 hypothetical protein GUITHDRAFT_107186 [Guillardia theta CCMP2712]